MVRVCPADLGTVLFHGSLIQVTGTHADTGDPVTFMGDTRCVITLLDAVQESGEQQMAWVEPHMTWSRCPASETSCRVLLHVIAETACHAGHLDAARELIDGQTWLILT